MAEKKAQMGDFIGFSFNGIHSSELGLVRVSDGNRYEKNLFPAISDKTVQVPGRDGFYYFGSSYNTREMTVKVAFDNLEEKEFRKMVEHFKDKKPHFLWFDELPYKEYLVKIKSPPNFKYLCFDEDDKRIYKGEGTIIFVCYSPYARARAKSLTDPIDKVIVKNETTYPDWFNNYYLDGNNNYSNWIVNGVRYQYPPTGHNFIIENNNNILSGENIRALYGMDFLKLYTSNSGIISLNDIYEDLANFLMSRFIEQDRDFLQTYNIIKQSDYFFIFNLYINVTLSDSQDYSLENYLNCLFNQNLITLNGVEYGANDFNNNFDRDNLLENFKELIMACKKENSLNPLLNKPFLGEFYNFLEWVDSSKIPPTKPEKQSNSLIFKNCGDIDMDVKILISPNTDCKIYLKRKKESNEQPDPVGTEDRETNWKFIEKIKINKSKLDEELNRRNVRGKDKKGYQYNTFFLDSKTKLFRAYDNTINNNNTSQDSYNGNWDDEKETNEVFNNCIVEGDFFKIPADNKEYKIKIMGADLLDVEYTYLYY